MPDMIPQRIFASLQRKKPVLRHNNVRLIARPTMIYIRWVIGSQVVDEGSKIRDFDIRVGWDASVLHLVGIANPARPSQMQTPSL